MIQPKNMMAFVQLLTRRPQLLRPAIKRLYSTKTVEVSSEIAITHGSEMPLEEEVDRHMAKAVKKRRIDYHRTEFYRQWVMEGVPNLPVSRPPVTELEFALVKTYVRHMQVTQKNPRHISISELTSRVSLLKAIGAEVSDIVEAPEILYLDEDEVLEYWRLLTQYTGLRFTWVTGPMLACVTPGNRYATFLYVRRLLSRCNNETSRFVYIKKRLNISEAELQQKLLEESMVVMQSRLRMVKKMWRAESTERKLEVFLSYGVTVQQVVDRCLEFLMNPVLEPSYIKSRLWYVWYHNIDMQSFPLQLLSASSEERFHILVDLFRHNGQCTLEKAMEIYQKKVILGDDHFFSVWGYQFLKMSPARGKANIIFLIDKGFHLQNILDNYHSLRVSLPDLKSTVDALKQFSIEETALDAFTLKMGMQVDPVKCYSHFVQMLFALLKWQFAPRQSTVEVLGIQPLGALLKNYTVLRHCGFTESNLQAVPQILAHDHRRVLRKVEHILRSASAQHEKKFEKCATSSSQDNGDEEVTRFVNSDQLPDHKQLQDDMELTLNFVQYSIEKEENFRNSLL